MSEVKLYGDLPETAVVSVTIEALRGLYAEGFGDGNWDDCDAEPTIDVECGFYRFPSIAKLEGATIEQQAEKVREEAYELVEAVCCGNTCYEADFEAMDAIHAAEGFLRMRGHSDEALSCLQRLVIEKNRKRGYYGNGKEHQ